MSGDPQFAAIVKGVCNAACLGNADGLAENAACRTGSESQNQLRLHDRPFAFEPPAADVDLLGSRRLVQPPLASRDIFEVFDRVGQINLLPIDARSFE